jgi:hypothetical protein
MGRLGSSHPLKKALKIIGRVYKHLKCYGASSIYRSSEYFSKSKYGSGMSFIFEIILLEIVEIRSTNADMSNE